jgi:ABC-2 type transport system ATP-binding protein
MDKGKLVLQEEFETLQARGASITGAAEEVDRFVRTMKN